MPFILLNIMAPDKRKYKERKILIIILPIKYTTYKGEST